MRKRNLHEIVFKTTTILRCKPDLTSHYFQLCNKSIYLIGNFSIADPTFLVHSQKPFIVPIGILKCSHS